MYGTWFVSLQQNVYKTKKGTFELLVYVCWRPFYTEHRNTESRDVVTSKMAMGFNFPSPLYVHIFFVLNCCTKSNKITWRCMIVTEFSQFSSHYKGKVYSLHKEREKKNCFCLNKIKKIDVLPVYVYTVAKYIRWFYMSHFVVKTKKREFSFWYMSDAFACCWLSSSLVVAVVVVVGSAGKICFLQHKAAV